MPRLKLTCQTCGTEGEFEKVRDAFAVGWDVFNGRGQTTSFCPKCPSGPWVMAQVTPVHIAPS